MNYKELTAKDYEGYIIRINNLNNFVLKEPPALLHPSSLAYLSYWSLQKKRCIEGLWSPDDEEVDVDLNLPINYLLTGKENQVISKKWRWMPGNLFFYGNFGTISYKKKGDHKSASKKKQRPLTRDVEWELSYNYAEARGFSGFKDDDEWSCERELFLFLTGKEANPSLYAFDSKGNPKKFKPAREYLRELKDKPYGLPLYNNSAKDLFILGTRDFGKSYYVSQAIMLYSFLFDDAKEYNQESIVNPYSVFLVVGAAIQDKSVDLCNKLLEGLNHLIGSYGEGTKQYTPSPLKKNYKGNLNPNNKENAFRHKYDVKIGGEWKEKGSGTTIQHVTYTISNAEAGVGKRTTISILEEVGLIENLLAIRAANKAILMESGEKFGSQIYIGTGGNIEKVREAEIIFTDPESYDCLAFENTLEKGAGKIGFFLPSIFALQQFKDDNGNTNIEKALAFKLNHRKEAEKATNPSVLASEMMSYPLLPSEMFLQGYEDTFPVVQIKERIAELTANDNIYKKQNYYGNLEFTIDGFLAWKNGNYSRAIEDYPLKDNKNKEGLITIFEMPKKDKEGRIIPNRYIQGTDTYDDDASSTDSLGCTYIFDLFTEEMAAVFVGRRLSEEFYEVTMKLCLYYNAAGSHLYENNKKGLYSYYNKKNKIHLLADTPEYLSQNFQIKLTGVGNQKKGVNMTSKALVTHGITLQADWLKQQNTEGEYINLKKERDIGYLRECLYYRADQGNYDRISARSMVFMLREQLYNRTQELKNNKVFIDKFKNSEFFNRYNKKKVKPLKFNFNDTINKKEERDVLESI